ncbi:MAG TPA: 3-hydroxyacyl-CoA dehydrogenase family protein, partial [Roseimicrobium sp.]|nr:3-hydroxyacyl-CoA dehydrogenase family protein [Roseimicrobium sp.]
PGFLVNRILMPYLMEAVGLFANGADVADIDNAMLDFGMPMGPLRLLDEVGLDVARHVAGTLSNHFKDRMIVPAMIDRMVEGDLLGRKSKERHGFYRHYLETPQPNDGVKAFQYGDSAADLTIECLQRRMVLPMINEAARCLEEEVVQAPEDIDFAMVMGTGFAPFRGGPLRYADSLGMDLVLRELLHEVEGGARHFEPCGLLRRKWTDSETFYPRNGGTS